MSLKLVKNLLRLKFGGLAIFATVYELMGHRFIGSNEMACQQPMYTLVIEQRIRGKPVGKIVVHTCPECDPGL